MKLKINCNYFKYLYICSVVVAHNNLRNWLNNLNHTKPDMKGERPFYIRVFRFTTMNNLSGRSQRIKQLDKKLYKKFLDGVLTLEQCEQLLKIKQNGRK